MLTGDPELLKHLSRGSERNDTHRRIIPGVIDEIGAEKCTSPLGNASSIDTRWEGTRRETCVVPAGFQP